MIALKFFAVSVICGLGARLGWGAGSMADDMGRILVAKFWGRFK